MTLSDGESPAVDLGPARTVVIVGAGASYDCVAEADVAMNFRGDYFGLRRLPLTKDLIANTEVTRACLGDKESAGTVIAWLHDRLAQEPSKGLENHLSEYEESFNDRLAARARLRVFKMYLHDLVRQAQVFVQHPNIGLGHTAYTSLASMLAEYADKTGPLLVVNYNYDTLLDRSIGGALPDFPGEAGRHARCDRLIQLAKPHGSIQWCRSRNHGDEVIWHYEDGVPVADRLQLDEPPVALPMANKDEWLCPPSHQEAIERADPRRLILIGWRAADTLVLHRLAERRSTPKEPVDIDIVTDQVAEAVIIQEALRQGPLPIGKSRILTSGFHKAVTDGSLKRLIHDADFEPVP